MAKDLLTHAAELIVENGNREVDISLLAERAHITRAAIYGRFGKNAKAIIYREIISDLVLSSRNSIELVLRSIDPASSPMEKLASVFRATLVTFKANPTFGKVVLRELHVRDQKEGEPVLQIFARIDSLLKEAKSKGHLAPEVSDRLDAWKIRQILFSVTRALLRGYFLEEGFSLDSHGKPQRGPVSKLTEKDVEIEMLRVIKIYCSSEIAGKIQNTIDLLLKTASRKRAKQVSI